MESAALQSFLYSADSNTEFPLENIPFGVAVNSAGSKICCTRIADNIIDLQALEAKNYFDGKLHAGKKVFDGQETLNKFAS
jgi:fumarylacetoacetase